MSAADTSASVSVMSASGFDLKLATGRTSPLPVDPQAWARMGYVRPKAPNVKGQK